MIQRRQPTPTKDGPGWGAFLLLLTFNGTMAHGGLPFQAKVLLALLLAVLILAASWKTGPSRIGPWDGSLPLPGLSTASILLLVFAAFFLRFHRLTSIVTWPSFDEAMFGYFAADLAVHWNFDFFYGIGQIPPMFFWVLAAVFKVFGVSLHSLWLAPALLSAATLPLVFLTARRFLGTPAASLFSCLWAFGFWPLYEGRFCVQYALYMFWLWLTLWLLASCLRSSPGPVSPSRWAALGALTGLGLYVSTGWPLVAVGVAASVLTLTRKKPSSSLPFLATAGALALPLLVQYLQGRYGLYIQNLWAFDEEGLSWKGHSFNAFLYLSGLFWGIPPENHISSYGPVRGGMLNPLLGSFFFIGLVVLLRSRSLVWAKLVLFLLPLALVPAVLTKDLEFFRIFQVLPLLLFIVLLGIQHLLQRVPAPGKPALLAGALLVSMVLDVLHLFAAYPRAALSQNAWPFKDNRRFEAFRALDALQKEQGPGLIFERFQSLLYNGFDQKYSDQSLSIAARSFNALENPSIPLKGIRWFAVLCDSEAQSYLSRMIPEAVWAPISYSPEFRDGLTVLGIAPYDRKYKVLLERWREVDLGYRKVVREMLGKVGGMPHDPVLRALFDLYPLVKGDPFLEAGFWKKVSRFDLLSDGAFLVQEDFLGRYQPNDHSLDPSGSNLATVYLCAGKAYKKAGRYKEALKAYEKAGALQPKLRMPKEFREKLLAETLNEGRAP